MSHSGKLTDAYEGYSDINKRLIAHIGNSKERFFKFSVIIATIFLKTEYLDDPCRMTVRG